MTILLGPLSNDKNLAENEIGKGAGVAGVARLEFSGEGLQQSGVCLVMDAPSLAIGVQLVRAEGAEIDRANGPTVDARPKRFLEIRDKGLEAIVRAVEETEIGIEPFSANKHIQMGKKL